MPAFNEWRYNLKCEICLLRQRKGAETKFNSLSNEKPSVGRQEYSKLTRNSSFSNENVLSSIKIVFLS